MSKALPVPCRLYILMARKANKAVILRRGPARWVELILWDTGEDRFQRGQWFHGRVYEERCDLSPDGTKFIYFASKYGRKRDADMLALAPDAPSLKAARSLAMPRPWAVPGWDDRAILGCLPGQRKGPQPARFTASEAPMP